MSEESARLKSDVAFLYRVVIYQTAQLRALQQFCAAHIADLSRVERARAFSELDAVTKRLYDELILTIGDRDPTGAEASDLRRALSPEERAKWFPPGSDWQSAP